MSRRPFAIVALLLAVTAVVVAYLLVAGRASPDATPGPTVSGTAAPSGSGTSEPSAAPSESTEASASAGAGSPPGVAWQRVEGSEADASVESVRFIDGRWFATGQLGLRAAIWLSDDGVTWTRSEITGSPEMTENEYSVVSDVVALGDGLVAIGGWGGLGSEQHAWVIWRSTDGGATWTETRDTTIPFGVRAITAGGPGVVGVYWIYGGTIPFDTGIVTSGDGETWLPLSTIANSEVLALVALEDRLIAVGTLWDESLSNLPSAWLSDDGGETWRHVPMGSTAGTDSGLTADIAVVGAALVAVGASGFPETAVPTAWISEDAGETWRVEPMGTEGRPGAIAVVDGGLVVVGNQGAVDAGGELAWSSADGITWADAGPIGDGDLRLTGAASDGRVVIAGGACIPDVSCGAPLWRGELAE